MSAPLDDLLEAAYLQGGDGDNPSPRLRAKEHAHVKVVSSPDPRITGRVYPLTHERTRMGHYACTDLYLCIKAEGPFAMTRINTLISFRDGRFWVEDPGSTYGTTHNGKRLVGDEQRPLEIGDTIQVGGRLDEDTGELRGHATVVFLGKTA